MNKAQIVTSLDVASFVIFLITKPLLWLEKTLFVISAEVTPIFIEFVLNNSLVIFQIKKSVDEDKLLLNNTEIRNNCR
jgi:hypothetical protein